MRRISTLIGALVVAAVPMTARALPSVNAILQQTKDASDPPRPSTRTITITVDNLGEAQKFIARQARKKMADGKRMTTVLMEPEGLRGMAYLVFEPTDKSKPTIMWMYLPFVRRVRKLIAVDNYEHFLGTDFTYSDLGFSFMRSRVSYRLLGVEPHAGTTAYKVEEKFLPGQLYYSRIVTWIAKDTMLPLERDYYDPTGTLWKRETFDSVATINGMPTVMHVQMKDLDANTSSDLNVSELQYDVELPDTLFDPDRLPRLTDKAEWSPAGGAAK
jgi:hypothetical protein